MSVGVLMADALILGYKSPGQGEGLKGGGNEPLNTGGCSVPTPPSRVGRVRGQISQPWREG
jgi:hypothetical protein